MAVDAADVLQSATVHDDLDGALAGATTVVGTSRRKGKYRRPHYPLDQFGEELARSTTIGELAIVFGREDHGLADVELDRCTHLVYLPASDLYPSFNLSHAVLLVAYELCRAATATGATPEERPEPPAGHEEREAMYQHLQQALLAIGFLQQDTTETLMRRLRRLLGRAALTSDEVKIFRGMARQSLWVAQQAGKSVPPAAAEDDES
jgi:tRNA/rRNA methyltransferase